MSTEVHVTFNQRDTFSKVIHRERDKRGQVVDLSGLTAEATFKVNYTTKKSFNLPVAVNMNGEVILSGDQYDTDVAAGRYVYDIVLSNGVRIVRGLATVNPAVSF